MVTPHVYGHNVVMIATNEHSDIYLDYDVMINGEYWRPIWLDSSWLQILSCLYFPGYIYLAHNIVNVLNTEVSVVHIVW